MPRFKHSRRFRSAVLFTETLEERRVLSAIGVAQALHPVIVVLQDDVVDVLAFAENAIGGTSGSVNHTYEHALHGFSASLPVGRIAALSHDPRVVSIEPDGIARAASFATEQRLPTGVDRIDAELSSIAGIGTGNSVDVDVAILDTGIDYLHPDLNVVGGVRVTSVTKRGKTQLVYNESPSAYDDPAGHGTHVAGVVGARDNGFGVVGVAPGARLWSIAVLNADGTAPWSQIIAGIDWVTAHADTIEIANLSFSGSYSAAANAAIQRMVSAGIFTSVAAGNYADNAANYSPSSEPLAFTVSSLDDYDGKAGGMSSSLDDQLSSTSNYGSVIDAAAPGKLIWSTWAGGTYQLLSGTSVAAPYAAGAAALHIAAHGRAADASDVLAIGESLISEGIPMSDWRLDGAAPDYDPDPFHEPMIYVGPGRDASAPQTPTDLITTANSDGSVTAEWTSSADPDVIGYGVYASTTPGGPYQRLKTISSSLDSRTTVASSALTSGTTYYFAVTAFDTWYNESTFSSEASALAEDVEAPAAPTGLLVDSGDGQVSLSWTPVAATDAEGYRVYRSNTSGGPYSLISGTLVAAPAYVDAAVTNGSTYYYVVTAVDLAGNESALSAEVSGTPAEVVAPAYAVAGINWTTISQSGGKWTAQVSAQIVDGSTPAAGVPVSAVWSKPVNRTSTGTTDISGQVAFSSGTIRNASSVVFTITAINGIPLDVAYSVTINKGQSGQSTEPNTATIASAGDLAGATAASLIIVDDVTSSQDFGASRTRFAAEEKPVMPPRQVVANSTPSPQDRVRIFARSETTGVDRPADSSPVLAIDLALGDLEELRDLDTAEIG